MTLARLLGLTALGLVFITIIKLVAILWLDIGNIYIQYAMWLFIAAISIACVRRLGVINYMEAVLVLIIWLILSLAIDGLIFPALAGNDVYSHVYLWIAYLVMVLAVFLFHKKRHVELRKVLKEKAKAKG